MKKAEKASSKRPAASELSRVAAYKIFFGHQSVGDDIVRGLKELLPADAGLKLNIVSSAEPQSVEAPAFIESHIGTNGDPQSKADAFAAILDKGMGRQGGIAMYKFCYVDIDGSTNAARMFENYRRGIETIHAKYPLLKIVHITVPLTTVEPGLKAWAKKRLGRTTARDIDARRNEYNRLLLTTYSDREPVFDLAAAESTRPDGTRSAFFDDGQPTFSLVPEFTADGGHLNEAGRRAAAEQLLRVLAGL